MSVEMGRSRKDERLCEDPPEILNHPDRKCKDLPSSLFFPDHIERHRPYARAGNGVKRYYTIGGRRFDNQHQAARFYCHQCPVRRPCAQYALENFYVEGIWGALSEEDRVKMWRSWGIKVPPLSGGTPGRRYQTGRTLET
jgi:hypothetical protein